MRRKWMRVSSAYGERIKDSIQELQDETIARGVLPDSALQLACVCERTRTVL
jgi:hypothetical protein